MFHFTTRGLKMNLQQAKERLGHREFSFGVIAEVLERDCYFSISVGGSPVRVDKPVGRTPKIGQNVTFYFFKGSFIQGVDIDGEPIFFKSEADLEVERQEELERIEAERAKQKIEFFAKLNDPESDFNRRLHRLPKVFQQCFKKFFRLGEHFWSSAWHELVACETALKIAYACKSWQSIHSVYNMTWHERKTFIPSIDDEISTNQLEFACFVANLYLKNPKWVINAPGARSNIISSKPYIGR